MSAATNSAAATLTSLPGIMLCRQPPNWANASLTQ